MKKIFLILLLLPLAFACKETVENEFKVEGTFSDTESNILVFIEEQDENGMFITLDSTKINNGKFSFTGISEEPVFRYLQFQNIPGKIEFIAEQGNIEIVAYADSLRKSKISGTLANDALTEYITQANEIQKKRSKFQEKNSEKLRNAREERDTATINQLMKENNTFNDDLVEAMKSHIKNHSYSLLSLNFIEQLTSQPNVDIKELSTMFNTISEKIKNTKNGQRIQDMLKKLSRVSIGNKAPDFSAPNPDGNIISLYENLGKVTIIDFWASWCGPCRIENPNVVALYNEFKDKGLQIIGVSLDRPGKADEWKQAIEADKLTWLHVSNLKYWNDPIVAEYNVEGIPAVFVLDASGTIVAKNLRGVELKAKVAELLE
ncbi:MAG: TlpA disulfide reductase family protein [Flavobacteriaceae bacterium]|jgi:peroxiredoxin|nr:TlpA disulfide reductase family protein [Flavobacteriaceae bacterium]